MRSSYQEGRVEIQLSRGKGRDPVIKRGGLRSSYQEGRVEIQLSCLTLPNVCAPSQNLDFQHPMLWSFLCSVSEDERWLFVLLILVDLLSITVEILFS